MCSRVLSVPTKQVLVGSQTAAELTTQPLNKHKVRSADKYRLYCWLLLGKESTYTEVKYFMNYSLAINPFFSTTNSLLIVINRLHFEVLSKDNKLINE